MKKQFALAAAIALLVLGAYFGPSFVVAQDTSSAAFDRFDEGLANMAFAIAQATPPPAMHKPPSAPPKPIPATQSGTTTPAKAPEPAPPIPANFNPELQLRVTKLLENPPPDINLAKALINNKIYGCPAGSVTFIQLIAPAKVSPGESGRDYKSLFAVTPGQLLQADGNHNFHLFCAEVKEQ